MKTLTATELKTRTGDFFEALLTDGKVTVTRNGRSFRLCLEKEAEEVPKTLGAALAMDLSELELYPEWELPKAKTLPLKKISFDR